MDYTEVLIGGLALIVMAALVILWVGNNLRKVSVAILFALLLAMSGSVYVEAAPCQGSNPNLAVLSFETITVSSTAIGATAATAFPTAADSAIYAVFTTETNSLRWRADGIAPTAAVGHLVAASSTIEVCGTVTLKRFLMIRTTSDATVSVTYFKGL